MTCDGGAGFLQALGWHLHDAHGNLITTPATPLSLAQATAVTAPADPIYKDIEIIGLIDVDVPLLPEDGVAAGLSSLSFAPQKGVKADEMDFLSQAIGHFEKLVYSGQSHSIPKAKFPSSGDFNSAKTITHAHHFKGAGGGLGFALQIIGADCRPGAEEIFSMCLSCMDPTENIDRIITGEGCFDLQSLQGKVTGTIIDYAVEHGIPVTVVCGRCQIPAGILPRQVETLLLSQLNTRQ